MKRGAAGGATKTAFVECQYTFSAAELNELGQRLALACRDVYRLKGDLTESQKEMRARIEHAQNVVAHLSDLRAQGYEMRPIECIVEFGIPSATMKRIVRQDTGEVVAEEPMTEQERQGVLNFPGNGTPQ